ncbi:MAG TPA: helix-turn-helix domain-containing protein [Patescibacteria group bacterium]|nr:helix-turn-helix domain-containing protein [Patescibacteria group bacterium]
MKPNEAKVYFALLELGSATVGQVATLSVIPRSSAEVILKRLTEKGLAFTFRKKQSLLFGAHDPRKVLAGYEEKTKLLAKAVPTLNSLYGSSKHEAKVRYYEGMEGLRTVLREVYSEAQELLAFGSADEIYRASGDFMKEFVKQRVERRIPLRAIILNTPFGEMRKDKDAKELRHTKLIPVNSAFDSGLIQIWENKIAIYSFKPEITALVIESPVTQQTLSLFFNELWEKI